MHAHLLSGSRMLCNHWQSAGKKIDPVDDRTELEYYEFLQKWFIDRGVICSAKIGDDFFQFPSGLVLPGLDADISPRFFVGSIPGVEVPYKDGAYILRTKTYTRMLTTFGTDKIYTDTGTHLAQAYYTGSDTDDGADFLPAKSEIITSTGESLHLYGIKQNCICPLYDLYMYEMDATNFTNYGDEIKQLCYNAIRKTITIPKKATACKGSNYKVGSVGNYSMTKGVLYYNGLKYNSGGAYFANWSKKTLDGQTVNILQPLYLRSNEVTHGSFIESGLPTMGSVFYSSYNGRYFYVGWRLRELRFVRNLSINEVFL